MIGGRRPLVPEILHQSDRVAAKSPIFDVFSLTVTVFTALHGMQTRSSDENSVRLFVRLSVCLSVTRVYCDNTKERSVQIFYSIRKII